MADEPQTRYPEPDQIEQLHQEIAKKGFDPIEFRWVDTDSAKTPGARVRKVLHQYTGSSFVFEIDGEKPVSIRRVGTQDPEELHPRRLGRATRPLP